MLRRFVTIKAINEVVIKDRRLSQGKLVLTPGESFGLPNDVYMDHRRRLRGKVDVFDESVKANVDVVDSSDEDLSGLSMAELRAKAVELQLSIPVGTTKIKAAELIAAAGKEVKNEEV